MNWKLLWLILGCLLAFPPTVTAQIQTIRKEVRQIFGGSQSADDARVGATARAKREALEEAGTYLQSLTVVRNQQIEEDEILALSSGVLRATIIEEEPFVEGSAFGIWVVAEVEVELSTLEERVRRLLANREHLSRLQEAERRIAVLLAKLDSLEAENALLAAFSGQRAVPTQQQEALGAAFSENTKMLAAQEWFMKGVVLWNGSAFASPEEAVGYFSEALRLDPNRAEAYNNRGNAYSDLGQYRRAIEDYDNALRIDPDYVFVYNNRGNAYNNLGQYQRAIADFDNALRLDPEYVIAYLNRSKAYFELGQYQRVIADFDNALRLDPGYISAYYNRGLAYDRLGRREQAVQDWRKAC